MATTYEVEQLLVKESGRIGPDIYRKTVDTSPWLKLVKQDAWPDEMGDTVSLMVYERSLPYKADGNLKTDWQGLASNAIVGTANDGDATNSGNAIAPLGGTVEFGQTLRTYGLQHTSLNSPDVSLNDLRFPLKRKEQLSNIMQILTESTREVWIERYRDEYIRVSENKLTATTANAQAADSGTIDYTFGVARQTNGSFAYPSEGAAKGTENVELTQGILDRVYLALIRDGAGAEAYSRVNGAPVFLAIMSHEASDAIIKANSSIREDFRWSDRVNELLAPLGVQRTYKNFFHLIDPFVPRYNYTEATNTWVRVRPYVRVPVTGEVTSSGVTRRGVRYDLNPDYLTAAYEDTVIFAPTVFTSLVPKPLSGFGAMEFSPQNYRGEFSWRNIADRDNNPDGTVGFFRAIFASGSKPIFPNHGYVIRHKRSAIAVTVS
jgi:hypothetical protein